ncbi:CheR family methyltransferase, partial [Geoalkalibacter sp.]|uniref:CheR family methyltransferase n=1 Tax=Geoalkalibacter sp. TaxID=3041440 RepID=UPI00272E2AD2
MASRTSTPGKDRVAGDPVLAGPVIAIGASAEHLAPLKELLRHLPPESGAAFVILAQRGDGEARSLAQSLARCTALRVTTARSGETLRANRVYLQPAGTFLRLSEGRLFHDPAPQGRPCLPIGHFLRSLAEERAEEAVAVMLAGTSDDGTLGLRAIKAQGGLVLAQEVADLRHCALADWVLPPAALAARLVDLISLISAQPPDTAATSAGKHLHAVLALLQLRHAHDFGCYKPKTLLRRISRRMVINGQRKLEGYLEILRGNEKEIDALFADLLIGVTRFFRDPQAHDLVRQKVLPALLGKGPENGTLRAWVPGCSTGEEAYSLAMLCVEALEQLGTPVDIQIFATDLDPEAIAFARAGLYPEGILRDVDPARLERFFMREENGYRIREELREKILFAHHNLLKDPPFSRLDFISCRNLLIYLEPHTQQKLLLCFHQVLRPGGYLLLGASEHLGEAGGYFSAIDKKWRLFQRRETSAPRDRRLSLFPAGRFTTPPTAPGARGDSQPSLGAMAEKKLLREYAPAAVVVNRELDVVHFPSGTGEFLTPPIGSATFNLIRMAREDLQPVLRSLCFQAFKDKRKTAYHGLRLHQEGRARHLNIIADPFAAGGGEDLLLVVIQECLEGPQDAANAPPPRAVPAERDKDLLIQYLEEELKNKSESLGSALREYESSHEELMSINEELHSANEELETSREELQALNEELFTVNAEVQHKNEELARTSSDLSNLINSAHIATIFLDRESRVRRFTPAAGEIFNLIEADLGRPFHHISGQLDTAAILAGARLVLKNLSDQEQELVSADGRCYLLRIFPYRTLQDRIEGVVISFIDISARKNAEEERERQRRIAEDRAREAEEARRVLQAIIDHVPLGLGVADREGNLLMVSRFGLDLAGLPMDQVRTGTIHDYPKMWRMYHLDGERPARPEELPLMRAVRRGEVCFGEEWLLRRADGEQIVVAVHAAPIRAAAGGISGAVVAWSDITEARRQKLALAESERRLKVVIDNLPAMVFAADERGQILFWNKECERVSGYLAEEVVGNPMAPERLFADADSRRRWQQDICAGNGAPSEM